MARKNKYGYGLTEAEMKALRWANASRSCGGSYFIVGEGWTRYKGMAKTAPTKSVKTLFEKELIYKDEFGSLFSNSDKKIEVYRFTEAAVLVLAQHGGYKLPNGTVVSFSW